MANMEFWELDAWKKAHQLVLEVYSLTNSFPKEERYGMTDQMRRASSSVTANIAEGFERYHFKDKTRFYYQARGSVAEVQNFIMLAKDLTYINVETCDRVGERIKEIKMLINGLIRAISKQTGY
jgi:four helix bundle protein